MDFPGVGLQAPDPVQVVQGDAPSVVKEVSDTAVPVDGESDLMPPAVGDALVTSLGTMVDATPSVAGVPGPRSIREHADREAGLAAGLSADPERVVGGVVLDRPRFPGLGRGERRQVAWRRLHSNAHPEGHVAPHVDACRDRQCDREIDRLDLTSGEGTDQGNEDMRKNRNGCHGSLRVWQRIPPGIGRRHGAR